MDLIHAVFYGIFQGIFAYLPVSSDAQIRLIQALAGWSADESPVFTAFTAVIQLGPTLAVIIFMRREIGEVLSAFVGVLAGKGKTSPSAKMGMAVVVGTIPIVILGFVLKRYIEGPFRSLYVIALALILGAIVMYFSDKADREKRTEADVEVKDGAIVGLWQCLALIPGMSRSGCTISGSLFQGFKRPDAARFAFLLGIPSFSAAGIYELIRFHHELQPLMKPLAVSFVVSFIVAYACLAWFLGFLQKNGVGPFVWYRLVLGVVILGLVGGKVISAGDEKKPQISVGTSAQSLDRSGLGGESKTGSTLSSWNGQFRDSGH